MFCVSMQLGWGRWFVDHSSEPCDVRGLTSVVLPVIKDEPVRRFCSEAIP